MQIKIQQDLPFRRKRTAGSSADSTRSAAATASATEGLSPFQQVLEEILPSSEAGNRSLQELWADLPSVEKEFIEKQTNASMNRYKELVVAIARKTIEHNMKVLKIRKKKPGKIEEAELNVVKILNEKLDGMLKIIRSPDNSAFQLLSQMEEIRGILYAAQA
jgi:uncharacterized protein YaaR (DUF327 family)